MLGDRFPKIVTLHNLFVKSHRDLKKRLIGITKMMNDTKANGSSQRYRFFIGKYQFDVTKPTTSSNRIVDTTDAAINATIIKSTVPPQSIESPKTQQTKLEKEELKILLDSEVITESSPNKKKETKNSEKPKEPSEPDKSNEQCGKLFGCRAKELLPDPIVSKGHITNLIKTNSLDWKPFVCKVSKRLYNKRLNRWYLKVTDLENEYRVAIASQCFHLFEQNVINKEDIIYVKYYVITNVNPKKPKFIMFTNIHKIPTPSNES